MLINITFIVFPLFIYPLLIGIGIFHLPFSIPFKWFLGLIMIGFYINLSFILGINQNLTYEILDFIFILCFSVILLKLALFKFKINIKFNPSKVVYIIFIFCLLLYSLFNIIVNPIFGWDAVTIWYAKTKSIYFWNSIYNLPFVNYPNLGPTLWSYILHYSINQEVFGRLLFPAIYLFFFYEVFICFEKNINPYLLCLLSIFFINFFYNIYVANGYQDMLIFSFSGISCLLFLKTIESRNVGFGNRTFKLQCNYITNLFILALIGSIKNEGIILSLIFNLMFCIIIIHNRIFSFKFIFFTFILYLIILLMWPLSLKVYGFNISNIQGNAFKFDSFYLLLDNLDRIPIISKYFYNYFSNQIYIILISLFLTISMIFTNKNKWKVNLIFWAIFFLHSFFIFIVFYVTREDLLWHMDTAFSRLMCQHESLFVILIFYSLSNFKAKITKLKV